MDFICDTKCKMKTNWFGETMFQHFCSVLMDKAERQFLFHQIKLEMTSDIFSATKHLWSFQVQMWQTDGCEAMLWRISDWGTHVQPRLKKLVSPPTAGYWGPAERRGEGEPADQRENKVTDASGRRKIRFCFLTLLLIWCLFLFLLQTSCLLCFFKLEAEPAERYQAFIQCMKQACIRGRPLFLPNSLW